MSEADAKVLTSAKLADLSASLDAVRSEFNAHKHEARFLTLLSPMCPACQSGARGVRKSVLDNPATKSLATMIVWIPILDADGLPAAVEASASYRNLPVPQFWDGNQRLGKEVARSIDAPDWTAWDIYYFYPPGAEWGDKGIPKPEVGLVQDLPNGVVVGFKGTLPPAADQSRLREELRGRADVVGELSNFETLLARVAQRFAKRYGMAFGKTGSLQKAAYIRKYALGGRRRHSLQGRGLRVCTAGQGPHRLVRRVRPGAGERAAPLPRI